jgi:hypothetical protein
MENTEFSKPIKIMSDFSELAKCIMTPSIKDDSLKNMNSEELIDLYYFHQNKLNEIQKEITKRLMK